MSAAVKIAADIFCRGGCKHRPLHAENLVYITRKLQYPQGVHSICAPCHTKNCRPFCISRAAVAFYVGILTQISAAVIRAIL